MMNKFSEIVRIFIFISVFVISSCTRIKYEGNGDDILDPLLDPLDEIFVEGSEQNLRFNKANLKNGILEVEYSFNHSNAPELKNIFISDGSITQEMKVIEITSGKIKFAPKGQSYQLKKSKNYQLSFLANSTARLINLSFPFNKSIDVGKLSITGTGELLSKNGLIVVKEVYIQNSRTYKIPGDFNNLTEAMDYLRTKRISKNAIITIEISDGIYNYTDSVSLNHLDGSQIEIVGNSTSPGNVVLNFSNLDLAFAIDGIGHQIKMIKGLTIRGNNYVGSNPLGSRGIFGQGACQFTIENSIIENFNIGFHILNKCSVISRNLTVRNNNQTGIYIIAHSVLTFDSGVTDNNGADGVFVGLQSHISSNNSTFSNNGNIGCGSWVNSSCYFSSDIFSGNSQDENADRNSENRL